MIVVLCDNYMDAEMSFRAWIAFLHTPPSDEIAKIDKYALRVETSDGQCYTFIDYRFKNVFTKKPVIFETAREFFDYYWLEDPDPYRREYSRKVQNNE